MQPLLLSLLPLLALTARHSANPQQAPDPPKRNILFGPIPMDHDSNEALITFAQHITKDPLYTCSAVVQEIDLELWQKTDCLLLAWGDSLFLNNIKYRYEAASHSSFAERMAEEALIAVDFFNEYLDAQLISRLKDFKADMIVCDSQNVPCLVTAAALNIDKVIHFSTICPATWESTFKRRTSYVPSVYTPFDTKMSFSERAYNMVYSYANSIKENSISFLVGLQLLSRGKLNYIVKLLKTHDELYMAPCVPGVNYPEYYPSNVVHLGSVTARDPNKLSVDMEGFIAKYDKLVYFNADSYSQCADINEVLATFRKHPNIGFFIGADSIRSEIYEDIHPYNLYYIPSNMSNEALGHPKVALSIVHGHWKTILESLYHGVPVISVGDTHDKSTNGKLIEYHQAGVAFENECEVNSEGFYKLMIEMIEKSYYKRNAVRLSEIIRAHDASESMKEWVDYYFENGVEELVVHGVFDKGSLRWDRLIAGLTPVILLVVVIVLEMTVIKKVVKGVIRLVKKVIGVIRKKKEKEN